MRKRSKKRIPRDVRPWQRVNESSLSSSLLPAKKVVRWKSGDRRHWNTTILTALPLENVKLIQKSLEPWTQEVGNYASEKLSFKKSKFSKLHSLAKYKNFCLFSGRGRTYNRFLFIARHNLRKLANVGLISGLIK